MHLLDYLEREIESHLRMRSNVSKEEHFSQWFPSMGKLHIGDGRMSNWFC